MNTRKRFFAFVSLLTVTALLLTGCGAKVDTRDDPLSGYSAKEILPFATREVVETPTPTPSPTGTITQVTQQWQVTATPAATPQATAELRTYTRIETGDSGEDVLDLQRRLIELGYLTGTPDGTFGTQTQTAVRLFQKALGVSQTGIANVSLQEKLYASNAPRYTASVTPTPAVNNNGSGVVVVNGYSTLVRGDSGDAVAALQRRLQELGFLHSTADGKFGANTETAVKNFQQMLGLAPTGVAGSSLQEKLFSSTAPTAMPTATPVPTAVPTRVPTQVPVITATPVPASTSLSYGSRGEAVMKLQNRLKQLGYLTGTADGIYGNATVTAINAFERMAGLAQDGVASETVQTLLYSGIAPTFAPVTMAPTTVPTTVPTPTSASGYIQLQRGTTGDAVRSLQERLKYLGYFNGELGGNYLSRTEAAVRQFEQGIGRVPTGVATPELQEIIFSSMAPFYNDVNVEYAELSKGDEGTQVYNLQVRLKELGYLSGNADGDFGGGTEKAVAAFQKNSGLASTGIADVTTLNLLFSNTAPSVTTEPHYTAVPTAVPTSVPTAVPTSVPTAAPVFQPLTPGDTGDAVKTMQSRLKELGYFGGNIGGNYLEQTTAAVKQFQKKIGLNEDGVASSYVLERLYRSDAPANTEPIITDTTLRYGSQGDDVKSVQQRLRDLGWLSDKADGYYGNNTKNAVAALQSIVGLVPTGEVDDTTRIYIFASDAPVNSATAVPTMVPTAAPTQQTYYYEALYPEQSSGEAVKTMQRRLKELGYFDGDIGGNYLTKTTAAVVKFQQAIGAYEDGVASSYVLERLYASDAPHYSGSTPVVTTVPVINDEMSNGSQGENVRQLQQTLSSLGWLTDTPDGYFGGNTETAVREFQYRCGLAETGVADEYMLQRLYASDAPKFTEYKDLKYGDKDVQLGGKAIMNMQKRLIELGYLDNIEDNCDGEYGPNLQNAIIQIQTASGDLTPEGIADGIADKKFQRFLFSDNALMYMRIR